MERFPLRCVALFRTVHYPAGPPVRVATGSGETVTATRSAGLRVNLEVQVVSHVHGQGGLVVLNVADTARLAELAGGKILTALRVSVRLYSVLLGVGGDGGVARRGAPGGHSLVGSETCHQSVHLNTLNYLLNASLYIDLLCGVED